MKLAFLAPVSHSNALRLAVVRGVGSVILSPTAYASTGDPVAAWRFADDQHCALFVFWVAAGAAGIVLSPTDAVRSATGIMQTVMVGSPAQLLAGQGERYDLLLNLTNMNGVDHMSFSDTIVVADGQPGGRLYVAKRPGGTFEEIPKQAGKNWDDHAIVGSEVLATASDDLGSLYVRHPDGSVVLLKDDPTRSVGLIAADTNFMAWQEGSGGTVWTGYTRVEVWAAPFTTDPSSFHPYKAADIPNNGLYDFAFGEDGTSSGSKQEAYGSFTSPTPNTSTSRLPLA
jgi:hypothetical protein